MTENNPVYDVQVIRFTKSASTKALSSFLKKGFGHYVCLGHFDMMEVSPLTSNEFPLQVIQDDLQIFLLKFAKRHRESVLLPAQQTSL